MRVQKFPEAVEELSALQTAALWVHKHQQRTHVCSQPVVLTETTTTILLSHFSAVDTRQIYILLIILTTISGTTSEVSCLLLTVVSLANM